MQNGVLKRAILDFRWFYALKATPNPPFGSCSSYPQSDSHRDHSALAKPSFRVQLPNGCTWLFGAFKTMQNGILKHAIRV